MAVYPLPLRLLSVCLSLLQIGLKLPESIMWLYVCFDSAVSTLDCFPTIRA
ncbi:hypothetical protein YC2023_123031 [Brassica napus]